MAAGIPVYTMLVWHGAQRMELDWTQGPLAEGLRLYDAGEFFAAHEAWESVWLRAQEPEKMFLQGLIQVTAAFHHLQRNNPQGTTLLLQAALGGSSVIPRVLQISPLPCSATKFAHGYKRSKRMRRHPSRVQSHVRGLQSDRPWLKTLWMDPLMIDAPILASSPRCCFKSRKSCAPALTSEPRTMLRPDL